MGVTLYYEGKLREPQNVTDLVAELTDIARDSGWKYRIVDGSYHDPVDVRLEVSEGHANFTGNAGLKGIVLNVHPEAEGLYLLFDKEGTLRSLLNMTDLPEKREAFAFTKTQYAGIDVHISVLKLLEYVGERYMADWLIEDDSGYLTHRDRARAEKVFHTIDDAINAVSEAFDTITIPDNIEGNEDAFISMVEDRIKTFLPGAEIRSVRVDEEE